MGLFGGKKTYVSSTVYNMAGDAAERPNFLKTMMISGIIGSKKFDPANLIDRNYLHGPATQARSFHRWAKTHYAAGAVPSLELSSGEGLDLAPLAQIIPVAAGEIAEVTYLTIGLAKADFWAEQWVMANRSADFNLEWFSDYNDVTNKVTIHWPDATTNEFTPANFAVGAEYAYILYGLKTATTFIGSRLYIYKIGDGVTYLDDINNLKSDHGTVFPFIPIRINNEFLSSSYQPQAYELAKKAFTKATGKRGKKGLDSLIAQIKENPSLKDIDHAYMVYGVSLNAKDNSARKYLFKFFDFLRTAQQYAPADASQWAFNQRAYETAIAAFNAQRAALAPGDVGGPLDPAVSGTIPQAPASPVTSIHIKNKAALDVSLDQTIKWKSIRKTKGTGLKFPDAKVGEIFWGDSVIRASLTGVVFTNQTLFGGADNSVIKLTWQKTANSWETLEITGLLYENLIYNGKAVEITGPEALNDSEESGFLVPLHYETVSKMSIVDSTQMMTQSTYLVFNSYQVVKQKWYQTGIFKILVIIAIIALTIAFPPAAGLLGPAVSIGAALGFAGLTALIVGAVVNVIAGMILAKLLSMGAVAIFGAKLGGIIAAVAMVIAMDFASLANGASMAQMWGNMMSSSNLLQLTSAIGNGIAGYVQASAMGTMANMNMMLKNFEKQSKEINNMFVKEFGSGDFQLNPMMFTDVDSVIVGETPSMFLDRTLMTGSEIANMTIEMLHGFTDATLNLDTIGSQ